MKNSKMILAIGFVFNILVITAQQNAYVAAESGLSLREQPDINGKILSKLSYAQVINVVENTNKSLVVLDNGEKISGEWVKVETDKYIGYVFNGYLSPTKISKTIRLDLDHLNIEIKNLETIDFKRTHHLTQQDSAKIRVGIAATPEAKKIVLVDNDYKHVSLFQRYENSMSFMSEDSKCDATHWKNYDTEWKPLKQLKSNTFETLVYTENDWQNFIKMAMTASHEEITDKCGSEWLSYFGTVRSIKDYPISVSTNRVYIKLILTDFEDNVTEKIIEFEMPDDC
ncbi:SH3 domain-containing protein [Winogradskyella sp. SYSU M77433]|uniref:SH3 domain-containing protein n=1 Tax=Winogradskyella sp. SYSU M77433 TaxID=3042722 RepID=UPI0024813104|nr:SH3 domain-containing protein [Winogradskyella sp. SYSU M77433]MDH7913514.1 SH3 domain-containing protein [Winogradskyella sp. SYSU M77433]